MELDARFIPTEREMRALQEATKPNAKYNNDDLVSLYRKLLPSVIAAEARRYHSLSAYQQGQEAKANGKPIDSGYLIGTWADKCFIAGYRGEADPGKPAFADELGDYVEKSKGALIV